MHVLDHSLPEQSGYAYRSHAILCELQRHGVNLDALTSPKQGATSQVFDEVDGIRYWRTPIDEATRTSGIGGQIRTVAMAKKRIREVVGNDPANVIHAHSPCLNGLASLGHGVPLIYEMRSSWEDAAVSVGTTSEGSLRYRVSRALETHVARRADAIVVICEGLKQELLSRGIADTKITVVPNALPPEMFQLPASQAVGGVRERYDLLDARIIGFFGSFFDWEGVDELVRALPDLIRRVPNAHLLLAGGGRQEKLLKELVARLDLESRVTFAGRISHEEVRAFYGAADVMAFPRVSDRLTEMVTPIKPLEAMAQGTLVVASDVGGHKELIQHGTTGLLYDAGNRAMLVQAIADALEEGSQLDAIRSRARTFVETERQWSVVSRRYVPLYEQYGQRDG